MSIAAVATETTYALGGGASLGPFATVFPFEGVGDVKVWLTLNGQSNLLTAPYDYAIAAADPLGAGGAVTLDAGLLVGAVWPVGATVTMTRATTADQPSDFGEVLAFSPQAAQDAIEHIERQVQELGILFSRSVGTAFGEAGMRLPPRTQFMDCLVGGDPITGELVARSTPLSGHVGQLLGVGAGGVVMPVGAAVSAGAPASPQRGVQHIDQYLPSADTGLVIDAYVNQALADIAAAGGGKLVFGPRDYLFNTQINMPAAPITLQGVDRLTTRLILDGAAAAAMFSWAGAGVGETYAIPAGHSATTFGQTIPGADVKTSAIGDWLLVQRITSRGGLQTVIGRVRYVSPAGSAYLALDRDIPFPVLDTDTYTITKLSIREGGGARNLSLIGWAADNAAATGFLTNWTAKQRFEDIYYEGWRNDNSFAASFQYGADNEFLGTHHLKNSGAQNTTNTCDFYSYAQTAGKYGRIFSEQAYGFGPQWQWCSHGMVDEIVSYGGAERGMKFQGARSFQVGRIKSTFAHSTAVAFSYDSAYNHFEDVYIDHTGEVVGNSVGLWFADQGNIKNTFDKVHSYGGNDYEVAFFASDQNNRIRYLEYSGNTAKLHDVSGTNTIDVLVTVP